MLVAYASKTGQVKKFINKLGVESINIAEATVIDRPFVLITYTSGFGNVPETVKNFLKTNFENLKGVAASGNKVWGDNFAKSADTIASEYGVPVITKFEMAGTLNDVVNFQEGMKSLETY